MMSGNLHAEIELGSWHQGPVFDWLAASGEISAAEMRRTFNCGVGMVLAVDEQHATGALEVLGECGEKAWRIGSVRPGRGEVGYV
jgi:phosphoribosylformylglycinamidine cyclo-ligase